MEFGSPDVLNSSRNQRNIAGPTPFFIVKSLLSTIDAAKFSEALKGFPSEIGDIRRLELGSNVRVVFSTIGSVGNSTVAVEMATDTIGPNNFDGNAAFNILVNPAEIDQFADELSNLTSDVGKCSRLKGSA